MSGSARHVRRHLQAPLPRENRLLRGLAVQFRVIGALMMRELHTRFGRENLGYVWLFAEPAMLGGAVSLMHVASGAHLANAIPPLAFYVIGYTPFYMLRAQISRAASGIDANRGLLYHRQVTPDDIMISRSLLEGAACLCVTAVVTVYIGCFDEGWPEDPLKIIYGILLIMVWAHGIAMACAAGGARSEITDRLVHPAVYLFLPISGAFLMKDWLSPAAAHLLWYVPTVQMYEVIRDGQFGRLVHTDYSIPYMLANCAATNLLGMAALRAVRPRLVV